MEMLKALDYFNDLALKIKNGSIKESNNDVTKLSSGEFHRTYVNKRKVFDKELPFVIDIIENKKNVFVFNTKILDISKYTIFTGIIYIDGDIVNQFYVIKNVNDNIVESRTILLIELKPRFTVDNTKYIEFLEKIKTIFELGNYIIIDWIIIDNNEIDISIKFNQYADEIPKDFGRFFVGYYNKLITVALDYKIII